METISLLIRCPDGEDPTVEFHWLHASSCISPNVSKLFPPVVLLTLSLSPHLSFTLSSTFSLHFLPLLRLSARWRQAAVWVVGVGCYIQQEILCLDWLSSSLTASEMRVEESGNSFYLVSLLPFSLLQLLYLPQLPQLPQLPAPEWRC